MKNRIVGYFHDRCRCRRKGLLRAFLLVVLSCTFAASFPMNMQRVGAEKGTESSQASEAENKDSENSGKEESIITGYDLVYVIDNSKSVWGQSKERNNAFCQITEEASGKDVRIGIVYFADHIYKQLELTSMEEEEGSQKVLDFLDMTETDDSNIDTNIGTALEAAVSLLGEKDESREQMVVLFSDGINENAAGEKAYKEAADKKTKEQAELLMEGNVPIYCVYLQKARNDEDYLKNLVNYFSDENQYDAERFEKVTSDKIEKLDDSFAALFKNLENEVEIRQEESSSVAESKESEGKTTEALTSQSEETTEEAAPAVTEPLKEETVPETEASTNKGIDFMGKAALVGLIGLLAAALAAILFALTKGVKKARKSSQDSTEFKVDNDFGAQKMNYEWIVDDFENACDKWKLYEPEVYKLVKRGRISGEEHAFMCDRMEELMEAGKPVIASMNALIEENRDKFFEDGKAKPDIAKIREVNEELSKGAGSLKEIADSMSEILKKAEDRILN